jgi:dolichol-phosphate mannosyltransferase
MSHAPRPPELSVVVPTYNERTNVPILIGLLQRTLDGIDWEVIFVDDESGDGTAALVRDIGTRDRRVRCIRRIGRRGLAGASLEGMLSSQAPFVAVMDADLQHDESLLPKMLARLRADDADLVIGSRYVADGSAAGFSELRRNISRIATSLAHRLLNIELTDPMSGFFMLRRAIVDKVAHRLSTQGFKILLDIVATCGGALRVCELGYRFRVRQHGKSKLNTRIALDFLGLLIAKTSDDWVSFRFLMYCLVGLSGVGCHMAVFVVATLSGLGFFHAQIAATAIAIVWNFTINNALTYADLRLTGRKFIVGLIGFGLICAFGAISNVGVATLAHAVVSPAWLAGLCGAVVGAVWNYFISAALVWRR